MTFKDFFNSTPKTRTVEKDIDVNGKIVRQMVDEEVPYDERFRLTEDAWKARTGGANDAYSAYADYEKK